MQEPTPLERFMAKVSIADTGCWIWTGAKDKRSGYGNAWHEGRNIKSHRLAYVLHVGLIPEGLVIDHLCRTRECVNPDHLEPVTNAENLRRGLGHGSETHCPTGHPYDEENTAVYSGKRHCRACRRDRRVAA